MFERYTERARRVIFLARYEASQFGSTTIETEHLLLGLIREDKNLFARFLPSHPSIESIRKEIEGRTAIREKVTSSIDLPLSNECKRIISYAADEGVRLNHLHTGTEHLLLAILREEKCVPAQILHERGLRLNAIREELAQSPMPIERRVSFLPHQVGPLSPDDMEELLTSGPVPDADTAKRIAQTVWLALYGGVTVATQAPLQAELKFNVWIVSGSSSAGGPLFAFILQTDGRILSVGQAPIQSLDVLNASRRRI